MNAPHRSLRGLRRWQRVLAPVLLGATLVTMLHGHHLAAFGMAVLFFVVYVTAGGPSPERSRPEEE